MEDNQIAAASMILSIQNALNIKSLQLRLQAFDSVFQEMDAANKIIYISRYNNLLNENEEFYKTAEKDIKEYESYLTQL